MLMTMEEKINPPIEKSSPNIMTISKMLEWMMNEGDSKSWQDCALIEDMRLSLFIRDNDLALVVLCTTEPRGI